MFLSFYYKFTLQKQVNVVYSPLFRLENCFQRFVRRLSVCEAGQDLFYFLSGRWLTSALSWSRFWISRLPDRLSKNKYFHRENSLE